MQRSIAIRLIAIVWILIVSLNVAQSQPVLEPRESWESIFIGDQRVGYSHELIEKVRVDSEEGFRESTEMLIRSNRLGQIFEVGSETVVLFRKDGTPETYLRMDKQNGKITKEFRGRYQENQFLLKVIEDDKTEVLTLDVPPDFAAEEIVVTQMKQEGFHVGQKRSFQSFSASKLAFMPITWEVAERDKAFELRGKKHDVFVVHVIESVGAKNVRAKVWVLPDGSALQTVMTRMDTRTEKTTREEALADTSGLELFFSFMVPSNVLLPVPQSVQRLKTKVLTKEGSVGDYFLEDARQSLSFDGGDAMLTVQTRPFADADSLTLPIEVNSETESFLQSSRYIQSDDAEVVRTAKEIVGKETNAWKAAKRIVEWVAENTTESYDIAFASAKEVLDLRRGDCTEHAVLFAGLARAAGIPTKVCSGLADTGVGSFQYHAWASVYVGEWVDVDPALNETAVDATHLKMSETALSDTELSDFAQPVLLLRNDALELSITEYETDEGKTDVTQRRVKPPEVKGGTYINYEHGIRISRPNPLWMVTTDTPMAGALLVVFVKLDGSMPPPNANLGVQAVDGEMSLSEFVEQSEQTLQIVMQQYQREEMQTITINGREGLELVYSASMQDAEVRFRQICWLTEANTVLFVTFAAGADEFGTNKREFDRILDSLEFFQPAKQ